MYKLSFEEAEKPEIKMPAFVRSWRKQRNARTSTSASLTMLKPLTVWITAMCGKFLLVACWKESYDKPRQRVKRTDITLPTKVHLVKAVVFPVVMD